MVGFSNPPNDAALVRTVLAGDPVGLRTGRKDREAVGARRGLVQEVGSDVLGLPRHRPADPLGRGGRAPDPMAGRFSDLAVASTNHRKTQASSTAAGGAYVLRRLTPPQTAKVQPKDTSIPAYCSMVIPHDAWRRRKPALLVNTITLRDHRQSPETLASTRARYPIWEHLLDGPDALRRVLHHPQRRSVRGPVRG